MVKEIPKETLNGKPFKINKIKKKHWLYTYTEFNVDVTVEDKCSECMHKNVCNWDMTKLCMNYEFGRSGPNVRLNTCDSCIHRYTRYDRDEDKIPCFKCRFFNTVQPICPNCGRELLVHVEEEGGIVIKLWRNCECGYTKVEF